MNSETNKKPEGAELFHQGFWYRKGSTGYADYWDDIIKCWRVSGSVSNDKLLSLLRNAAIGEMPEMQYGVYMQPMQKLQFAVDQGMKFDSEKPRYDLLPPIAIDEMANVMTFGAKKYAPNSWQTVPNGEDRYLAAALRHAFAISRGEINDPETGLPHAAHLMCCAAFLTELQHGSK